MGKGGLATCNQLGVFDFEVCRACVLGGWIDDDGGGLGGGRSVVVGWLVVHVVRGFV
jgi:hypothetical protein